MSHLLTDQQVKQFFEDGYVIIPKFFTKEEIQPVMDAIDRLVDELAEDLFNGGKIKNKHKEEGFYTRLSKLEDEFPGASVLLHKRGKLPKEIAEMWGNPRLLDVIEQVLGSDIAAHPVWNLRTKTPNNPNVTVPWHQDAAYMTDESVNLLQPTAWIPFLDATVQNGCMQVFKGGHQPGLVAHHICCTGTSWYIEIDEKVMKESLGDREIVTCPIPLGGFLLINQLIPHRSLENLSNQVRWSVDLRWQRPQDDCNHGLKKPLLLRTAKERDAKPDWAAWGSQDRHQLFEDKEKANVDRFLPIITGPWMKRWPITNHNAHSEAWAVAEKLQQSVKS